MKIIAVRIQDGMDYFTLAIKKYAVFSGRAARSEFWYFYFVVTFVDVLCSLLTFYFQSLAAVEYIWDCFVLLPSLAIACRRLHDRNLSGWLQIFQILTMFIFIGLLRAGDVVTPFVSDDITLEIAAFFSALAFYSQKGTEGPNDFDKKIYVNTQIDKNISENHLEMIEKLADLKDRGILTEEEFARKKSELL